MKKALLIVKDAIGIIGSIVGIAWWLGATPDMVGEQVYAVVNVILPFFMVACGILIGWNAKGWVVLRSGRNKPNPDTVRRISNLQPEQKRLLESMFVYGQISTSIEDDKTFTLDGMSKMGLVYGDGGLTRYWWLTDSCRRAMEAGRQ